MIKQFEPLGVVMILLLVLLPWWIARHMEKSAKDLSLTDADRVEGRSWRRPFALFAGSLWAVQVAQQLYTSVFSVEKSWFGWDSFCVSPWSFVCVNLTLLGGSLTTAWPLTVYHLLTDERAAPPVDLSHPSGRCGVGDYMATLRLWSFLGLVAVIAPALLYLRGASGQQANFANGYYASVLFALAIATTLEFRTVRCALRVRRDYEAKRAALGATWAEVEGKRVPDDPTNVFLGDAPWKIPATITVVLGGAWVMLDVLGLRESLLGWLHR